jgi:glycosyltransferase involved in cell wall biosynthesis
VTNALRRERRVLTTVPADFSSLRGQDWTQSGLDVLDRTTFSAAGLTLRLFRGASEYEAVLLNGSGRIDQVTAALLARRRSAGHVVISDCTWQRGTWWLDRLACRLGIKAIDSPRVTYCVLSSDELTLFPRTWNVDPSRVVFTPFCHTLTEAELAVPPGDVANVFSGGDSMRDYAPLLSVARSIPAIVTLAANELGVAQAELAQNIRAGAVSHDRFVDLMRGAAVVVVPLRAGIERSAGQQTYLNAMALGKIVIATDSPGVRDYIEDGSTGLIVRPGDEQSLASALTWALDPSHRREVEEIGARARALVHSRFRPVDHIRRLIEVVDDVGARSVTTEVRPGRPTRSLVR